MKKGVRRLAFDDAGLPNIACGLAASENECPICHAHPPITGTGTMWKWFAFHFAGHLGYEIVERRRYGPRD